MLKIDNEKCIFEYEVFNKALVDSGCSESLGGESFIKTCGTAMGRKFFRIDIRDIFQMGEQNFKTAMNKRVPVKIGSHQEDLEVGVIEVEIPLVVS